MLRICRKAHPGPARPRGKSCKAENKEESSKIPLTRYHTINYTQSESNQYVNGITDIGHGKARQSSKNDFADNHIKFQSKSRNYSLASLPHRKNAYLCRDVVGSNEGYRNLIDKYLWQIRIS